MDWALTFQQAKQYLLKLPQQKVIMVCQLALVAYVAYLCAQMTWLFIPEPAKKSAGRPALSANKSQAGPAFNLSEIKALNLFGSAAEKPVTTAAKQEVEEAPLTKLRLTLTGVAASNDEKVAAAIIENNKKQETYAIGDKIDGTNATLNKVYPDRVIISQRGKMETLMLDGFDYNKTPEVRNRQDAKTKLTKNANQQNAAPAATKTVDNRKNKVVSERVARIKEQIANSPGKITDYIRISPHRVGGKTVGYRLMPGKDPEFFKDSGLKPGDIAKEINGKDLSDSRQAGQAMMELRKAQEISLVIDRKGQLTDILFSVNK